MSDSAVPRKRQGARALSELVGRVLDPVTAQRGFATADLVATWPEIVGARYADCTAPERIVWPRVRDGDADRPGVLVVRIDGPRAILFQHETGQVRERVNAFLGYAAIGQVRIVQAPLAIKAAKDGGKAKALDAAGEAALSTHIAEVEDDALRRALDRLGRGVLGDRTSS